MRKFRVAVLGIVLTATLILSQGAAEAGSAGKARGKVIATIDGVLYSIDFNAGASGKKATGGYIITDLNDPNGGYVSGRVDCFTKTGLNTAALAGPIVEDELGAFGSANGPIVVISVVDAAQDQISIDNSTSCAPDQVSYVNAFGGLTVS